VAVLSLPLRSRRILAPPIPVSRDATAPQLRPSVAPAPPRAGRFSRLPRPRLTVVEPAPRRRAIGMVVAALCAVIFVGLLGLTAVQVTLAQNQQQLDRINREVQDARDYYDRLRLAVARLQSPDYIVPTATDRLGMVPATAPVYLTPTGDVVNYVAAATGQAVGDPTSGTGAGRPQWGQVKEITGRAP
jgi:cell division protein FtsB